MSRAKKTANKRGRETASIPFVIQSKFNFPFVNAISSLEPPSHSLTLESLLTNERTKYSFEKKKSFAHISEEETKRDEIKMR
jgi:hypothetical protein